MLEPLLELVLVDVDELSVPVAVAAEAQKLVNQLCILERPSAWAVQAVSHTPAVVELKG